MKIDRKAGLHMDFKSHIPKLPKVLTHFILGLFIITAIFSNSIQTYATDHDDPISQAVESIVMEYNGTSSSTHGGNSAITNGVSYTRTGYLCYMLTKDGATTGLPAYAFQSPGYNGIAGSKWVCTSRRGHSVSSWYDVAPWGVTPWENGGSPSNEPKIKEWALTIGVNGKPNAQQFVLDTWGVEAEKSFQSDEYILVIETIMNFQYSISGGSSGGISESTIQKIYSEALAKATQIVSNGGGPLNYTEGSVRDQIADGIYRQVITKLMETGFTDGGARTFTSDPLIGTVPNLIQYKGQSTVFNSYTNKVAPHAEKIKVSEAGFTAYTGSGSNQLSDSEVQSYGVAMLIIHCKNDAIHTYSTS